MQGFADISLKRKEKMSKQYLKIKLLALLVAIIVMTTIPALAVDCTHCNATDISSLAMACPECGKNLHDSKTRHTKRKYSELTVQMLFTGDNPDKLPEYGKLFLNGKYVGNIPLTEKEARSKDFDQHWQDGLGTNYTAMYEKTLKNVPSGILKVEVEMRFKRLYGFGRSFKKVVFPYVSFKDNQRTTITHTFDSATGFSKFKPVKQKPIPIVSEAKLQAASGSVALNVPLFD
jgi:hypothetical protein